jgi:hypothetical protein
LQSRFDHSLNLSSQIRCVPKSAAKSILILLERCHKVRTKHALSLKVRDYA